MASFRKRNNKWEYRIRYLDPITNKYKEKSRKGFDTKKEAQLAASEVDLNIKQHMKQEEDITLEAWLEHYMEVYRKGKVADNTYDVDVQSIKRILPFFQQVKIRSVTPEMYQRFINYLEKEKKYSVSTILNTHGTMYSSLQRAFTNKRIASNPCEHVQLPKKKKKTELEYLPIEMIPTFLQKVKQRNLEQYYFFKCLLDTGMRKGEALALTWDDIDLKEKSIHIYKTYHYQTRTSGETKNKQTRVIRFGDSLKKDLLQLYNLQNQNKLMYEDLYRYDLNLVFATKEGQPIPNSTTFNTMKMVCKQIGIGNLPIHGLRHTHVVMHLEAGTNMKVIQTRLGHGSMDITADVYSHVSKKLEEQSIEAYEEKTRKLFE